MQLASRQIAILQRNACLTRYQPSERNRACRFVVFPASTVKRMCARSRSCLCRLGCDTCCRDGDADLLVKVNALEAEKQNLSQNVASLQHMLGSMQQQFGATGNSFWPERFSTSPDENQP